MGNNELNCGTPIGLVANCDGSLGGFFFEKPTLVSLYYVMNNYTNLTSNLHLKCLIFIFSSNVSSFTCNCA